MKLRRLDIHGFKSFYHRTTVVFDDGITAIVGPNGCGKSNVVDSMKWVMGEQGAKALRGTAMEDVIFAGSERRGPLGMCEVRLTFTNDGSAEVPTRLKEVPEIAIERHLERNEGSDYFINKQRCRLSDVQELVAGTGIGSGPGGQRAYAIIEQGQIERIVSARAEERRVLIEEAAGITRFRNRRKLAEKKMEETRQNLERVDDLVREVDDRLKGLRRQAKKAERYRAYKEERRAIGLKLMVAAHRVRREALAKALADVARRTAEEEDQKREVQIAEAAVVTARLGERACDDVARGLTEQVLKLEADARLAKEQANFRAREAVTLGEQLAETQAEQVRGLKRLDDLTAERALAAERLATLNAAVVSGDDDLEALESARKLAHRQLLDARADAERLRREVAEEAQRIAKARADQAAAARRAVDLRERAAEADAERAGLDERRGELREELDAEREAREEAETARAEAEALRQTAEAARVAARAELTTASDALRKGGEGLAALRARLASLEELDRKREDLGDGAKAVLALGLPGVLGTVPEVVEASTELERAVAAALGDRLKGLVVDSLDSALEGVARLKERGRGRAVFVARPEAPAALAEDRLGHQLKSALSSVLLDVALVEDLAEAAALCRAGFTGTVVTREGERIDAGAVVTGGAEAADPAPLRRRRELKELTEKVVAAQEARAAAEAAVEAARQAVAAEELRVAEAVKAVQAAEIRRAEARAGEQRVKAELDRMASRAVEQAEAAARFRDAAEEALEVADLAARALSRAEANRRDRDDALVACDEAAVTAEAARDEAVARLHEARTRAAERQARIDAAKEALGRLESDLAETTRRRERASGSVEELTARLEELSEERADAEERARAKTEEARGLSTDLGAAKAALEGAVAEVRVMEDKLKARRQAFEHSQAALKKLEMELQAARLQLEHLAETIQKDFNATVAEAEAECAEQAPPTAEDEARLKEIDALLEKMGDVNLQAIEECEEVEQRAGFLGAQRQDLLDALADLEKAIDQINRTSRKLFKETFEAVNERFMAVFPRLFRGGEAELVLTDPDDVLETGVEMLVQPPGKKVQHVALLSGGEKALCALALIFAVFQVKPSPFCLLDEVDAPLDDANIGRFNEVVREIARTSQVVLITHNKRTMEIADVLYGVTMEERGISKLVNVRMT